MSRFNGRKITMLFLGLGVVALLAGAASGYGTGQLIEARSDASDSSAPEDGATHESTQCAKTPTMTLDELSGAGKKLSAKLNFNSACPSGQLLDSNDYTITLTDDSGKVVAVAAFDFSDKPLVIPKDDGAQGKAESGATLVARFPLGTFWRFPDDVDPATVRVSTDLGDGGNQGSPSDDEMDSGTRHVELTGTPSDDVSTKQNRRYSKTGLKSQAQADEPKISDHLDDKWVPQVSSKKPGMKADGQTWTHATIYKEYVKLRTKYSSALLVNTSNWPMYRLSGHWATIIGDSFADADDALDWCKEEGLDAEHCHAVRISSTKGPKDSAKMQD